MAYPVRERRLKKRYVLRAVLALAALFWLYSLLLGPASRLGVARQLKERYGVDFVILSSQRASGSQLEQRVWSARTYVAAPRDDPDFRFFVSSSLVSDGFWPVLTRYLGDTYTEDQMLRIWQADAQAAGVDYTVVSRCYPFQSRRQDYHSGFFVTVPITDGTIDQVCALLSASMERMLAETPAQQGSMTSFSFRLRYHRDGWLEEDLAPVDLTLFYNSYLVDSSSRNHKFEWRTIDIEPQAIRQYILAEADRYERLNWKSD